MILELGGNDAAILLPDGSVDALVATAGQLAFGNNGQFCAAVKRVYVPTDKVEEVGQRLAQIASRHVLGPGLETGVTMGPIQNKAQFERVCGLVEDAKLAGGQVLAGGAPLDRPAISSRRRCSWAWVTARDWSTKNSSAPSCR